MGWRRERKSKRGKLEGINNIKDQSKGHMETYCGRHFLKHSYTHTLKIVKVELTNSRTTMHPLDVRG